MLGSGAAPVGTLVDATPAVTTRGVALSGSIRVGETWTAKILEGTTVMAVATHTVAASTETQATIAAALVAGLDTALGTGSGYAVAAEEAKLVASRLSGGAFTFSVTPGTAGTGTDTTSLMTTRGITLGGVAQAGETWSAAITEGAALRASASHTVTSGETVADITAVLASDLEAMLGASSGYAASAEQETLVVSNMNGLSFTLGVTPGASGEQTNTSALLSARSVALAGDVAVEHRLMLELIAAKSPGEGVLGPDDLAADREAGCFQGVLELPLAR